MDIDLGRQAEVLASVLEHMSDAFVMLGPDWRYSFANDRAVALLGVPHDRLIGRTMWEVFPELVGSVFETRFRGVMDAGVPAAFEVFYEATGIWVDVRAYRREHGVAVFYADVTERKEAEAVAAHELERARLLLQAADSLAESTGLSAVLGALAGCVLQAVPHTRVTIDLWDEDRRELAVAALLGPSSRQLGAVFPYEAVPEPVRRAIEAREITLVDYDALPRAAVRPASRFTPHLALVVPLVRGEHLVGLLVIDDPGERRSFTRPETEVAEALAGQAAVAVENARLFDAQRRQAAYAEALNRINDEVHSTLDFDEIMERVVVEVTEALGVDASAVHMHEGDHWVFRYSHGLPEGLRRSRLLDRDAPLSMRVARLRESLVVTDVINDSRSNRELMERFGIRSLIATPLVVKDTVVGVLFSGCLQTPSDFTSGQVDFTEKVAATLALALENARLYSVEHRIAETLQETLLSLPDAIPGIEIAHAYHSATEAARVGGDFYDVFELTCDLLGIVVGDVAGKGLEAAVTTSLVKNTIRAHALGRPSSPAYALGLANDVVLRVTPSHAFATVVFAVMNRHDGSLVYSNAGHTTAAVLRPDGTVAKLPANSPLLGGIADAVFEESPSRLEVGEILFLYTDGLIEARRNGEMFGEARLFELLACPCPPPSVLVRKVLDAVVSFTRGRLGDDLAILAVRRLAGERTFPAQQRLPLG